jgi:hypothetical protein
MKVKWFGVMTAAFGLAHSQTGAPTRPEFEVASIKGSPQEFEKVAIGVGFNRESGPSVTRSRWNYRQPRSAGRQNQTEVPVISRTGTPTTHGRSSERLNSLIQREFGADLANSVG